jgi:DNA repair exonuclease SbcCD ATPase subunit
MKRGRRAWAHPGGGMGSLAALGSGVVEAAVEEERWRAGLKEVVVAGVGAGGGGEGGGASAPASAPALACLREDGGRISEAAAKLIYALKGEANRMMEELAKLRIEEKTLRRKLKDAKEQESAAKANYESSLARSLRRESSLSSLVDQARMELQMVSAKLHKTESDIELVREREAKALRMLQDCSSTDAGPWANNPFLFCGIAAVGSAHYLIRRYFLSKRGAASSSCSKSYVFTERDALGGLEAILLQLQQKKGDVVNECHRLQGERDELLKTLQNGKAHTSDEAAPLLDELTSRSRELERELNRLHEANKCIGLLERAVSLYLSQKAAVEGEAKALREECEGLRASLKRCTSVSEEDQIRSSLMSAQRRRDLAEDSKTVFCMPSATKGLEHNLGGIVQRNLEVDCRRLARVARARATRIRELETEAERVSADLSDAQAKTASLRAAQLTTEAAIKKRLQEAEMRAARAEGKQQALAMALQTHEAEVTGLAKSLAGSFQPNLAHENESLKVVVERARERARCLREEANLLQEDARSQFLHRRLGAEKLEANLRSLAETLECVRSEAAKEAQQLRVEKMELEGEIDRLGKVLRTSGDRHASPQERRSRLRSETDLDARFAELSERCMELAQGMGEQAASLEEQRDDAVHKLERELAARQSEHEESDREVAFLIEEKDKLGKRAMAAETELSSLGSEMARVSDLLHREGGEDHESKSSALHAEKEHLTTRRANVANELRRMAGRGTALTSRLQSLLSDRRVQMQRIGELAGELRHARGRRESLELELGTIVPELKQQNHSLKQKVAELEAVRAAQQQRLNALLQEVTHATAIKSENEESVALRRRLRRQHREMQQLRDTLAQINIEDRQCYGAVDTDADTVIGSLEHSPQPALKEIHKMDQDALIDLIHWYQSKDGRRKQLLQRFSLESVHDDEYFNKENAVVPPRLVMTIKPGLKPLSPSRPTGISRRRSDNS